MNKFKILSATGMLALLCVLSILLWSALSDDQMQQKDLNDVDLTSTGSIKIAASQESAIHPPSEDRSESVQERVQVDVPDVQHAQFEEESPSKASIHGVLDVPWQGVLEEAFIDVVGLDGPKDRVKIRVAGDLAIVSPTLVSYEWELLDLDPGDYLVTYNHALVQRCTLSSGDHSLFAELMPGPPIRLLFVDAFSDEAVDVERLFLAYSNEPLEAWSGNFLDIGPSQIKNHPGSEFKVEDAVGVWAHIMTQTPNYGIHLESVRVQEGAVYVIELARTIRVEIALPEGKGLPGSGLQPENLMDSKLIVNGKAQSPIFVGNRGQQIFIEFKGVTETVGTWRVALPQGLVGQRSLSGDLPINPLIDWPVK